jgi:general secretion pathway protein D
MKRFILIVVLLFAQLLSFSQSAWSDTQKWKVNLKDADIRAFITQISDITGYSFVVDPRVRGNVTVVSNVAMNKNDIYEMFLSVLDVHGYAAIPSQDVIKIVQQNNAKQSAVNLKLYKKVPKQQMVTRVIQVKNTNALELVPILRPMVAKYGHLAGVASDNALIISDQIDNIIRISHIVEQLDTPSKYEIEVVQLKEAWVGDMVKLLEKLAPAELGKNNIKESARKYSIVADERSNRLILRGDAQFRKRMEALIAKLDQPAAISGTTKVIRLKHADAVKMAKMLKGLLGDISTDEQKSKGVQGSKKNSANVYADAAMNALVIRAEPSEIQELENIIKQLDQRRAQVMIEAAIVEVDDDTSKGLGIQWALFNKNGTVPGILTNFSDVGASASSIFNAITAKTAISPAVGGGTLAFGKINQKSLSWGGLIQALSAKAGVNLLSTPKIITMDNQESSIIVGQNIPVITGQSTSTGSGVSNPFTTVAREDIGIKLKVTPSISDGGTVRLKIMQENSSISNSTSASGIITNKSEIKTNILADDGETIVLGGLIKDEIKKKVSKVPLLGDIPFLGTLFRSSSDSHSKKNLLVFLRPTILRDKKASQEISQQKFDTLWELNLKQVQSSNRLKKDAKGNYIEPTKPSIDEFFKRNPLN